jgi:hypothetical protein
MDPLAAGMSNPDDPQTMSKAMDSTAAEEWKLAILEEFKALKDLGMYKLVPQAAIPKGCKGDLG